MNKELYEKLNLSISQIVAEDVIVASDPTDPTSPTQAVSKDTELELGGGPETGIHLWGPGGDIELP